MTTTDDATIDATPADLACLVHCHHCGRDGWHVPDRCPQLRDVALPRGAVLADVFEDGKRVVFGPERDVCGFRVVPTALQDLDGALDKLTVLAGPDLELTAGEARELARALMGAADVLEAWRDQ